MLFLDSRSQNEHKEGTRGGQRVDWRHWFQEEQEGWWDSQEDEGRRASRQGLPESIRVQCNGRARTVVVHEERPPTQQEGREHGGHGDLLEGRISQKFTRLAS